MKSILLSALFACLITFATKAQTYWPPTGYKNVTKDTINIRGVVYDYQGNPAVGVQIRSTNKELSYLGYFVFTSTDTGGRFTLNGALPYDTLRIFGKTDTVIINKGSRYLAITLPRPKIVAKPDTALIVASRRIKKKIPTFKVITNEQILDYYGIDFVFRDAGFMGEPGSFSKFIRSKIVYPQAAVENNIEGEVEIAFIVEKDGSIIQPKVIKGIGYGCDEAVIDAVKQSPKWMPAYNPGLPAATKTSVVVDFKLTDK